MLTKLPVAILALIMAVIAQTGYAFWTISGHDVRIQNLERRIVGVGLRASFEREKLQELAVGLARVETKIDALTEYLIPNHGD